MPQDTIAAIATAPGEAGIAIIRVSGPASLSIADRLFFSSGRPPSQRAPFTAAHGWIKSSTRIIDEVILLIMPAPHSYTREDVVEIQCHGGSISARRILQVVLRAGARPAEAGEFTQRAFLNGRIDLVQAEAVLDLIRSRSERAAKAAIEQLEGSLSDSFNDIYDKLIAVNADLEALLDFSEDDITPILITTAASQLEIIQKQLSALLDTWEEGHLLREGSLVVISGKPNVGKSTLFNRLLGKDRAIVSVKPGTTRDVIEETMILEGLPIRLVDTAGLRLSECDIESEGVRRARRYMQQADLHLYLVDVSRLLDEDDQNNIQGLDPCRSILILNKSDLGDQSQQFNIRGYTSIVSSLIRPDDLPEIRKIILSKLGAGLNRAPQAVISERHKAILLVVASELNETLNMLRARQDDLIVLCTSKIRTALERLGLITGKTYYDELLAAVFSKFCIGK